MRIRNGQRRTLGAREVGLSTIPVYVLPATATDDTAEAVERDGRLRATRGWRTAAKQPVKNVDLWQRLDAAAARHDVAWIWVRGHSGHPENERADTLARAHIAAANPTHSTIDGGGIRQEPL